MIPSSFIPFYAAVAASVRRRRKIVPIPDGKEVEVVKSSKYMKLRQLSRK